ncbi:hypothetical protein [Pleionea sp. CnH1-48]|uniref:hypothetical protein n=1 Tax=Pleionea sp. CnH1-48 TaxID=2954494 RepID=UPI0020982984|nr:hypothetical protein [Pleionea sp. CnH1-48]MCO7223896.1 hypothetical protein [Pleionea sp. CnH1-48]
MEKFIYRTQWAKEPAPYGAFDDYVIFDVDSGASFQMHEAEFDWLASQLHQLCFKENQVPYLQIVKEWNECIGFYDDEETSSVIGDRVDTLSALSKVKARIETDWGELSQSDLMSLHVLVQTRSDTST